MEEKQINNSPVFLGLCTLGAALFVVYVLFFSIAPSKETFAVQDNTIVIQDNWEQRIQKVSLSDTWWLIKNNTLWNDIVRINDTWLQQQDHVFVDLPKTPHHIQSTQELFFWKPYEDGEEEWVKSIVINNQEQWILYLPGTHHWRAVMKSAKVIWFAWSIQYILKNNDNTHFAYLGKELPDIASLLAGIEWKSIAITDEKDISTHWLFGDKIIFLQIPQYVGKKQLFFAYFADGKDRWFIQVDDDVFETTKPLLRELFAKWYNR